VLQVIVTAGYLMLLVFSSTAVKHLAAYCCCNLLLAQRAWQWHGDMGRHCDSCCQRPVTVLQLLCQVVPRECGP
jgi:hypothetical protein